MVKVEREGGVAGVGVGGGGPSRGNNECSLQRRCSHCETIVKGGETSWYL